LDIPQRQFANEDATNRERTDCHCTNGRESTGCPDWNKLSRLSSRFRMMV
jgi:hypothetical protein